MPNQIKAAPGYTPGMTLGTHIANVEDDPHIQYLLANDAGVCAQRQPSKEYHVNNVVFIRNNPMYQLRCTVAGTTAETELTIPTIGVAFTDGTVTWMPFKLATSEDIGSISNILATIVGG